MPAVRQRRWTRAEVLALIEHEPLATPRYEVVDGELFVTPSPRRLHQLAVGSLHYALTTYCRAERIGTTLVSPSDCELEPGVLVQPDVYVVPPSELYVEWPCRTLMLATEVLSPGSERGDRGRKRKLYHRRVPVYWLVDVEARTVEQWRQHVAGSVLLRDGLEWHPVGAKQPFALDLPAYFRQVFGEE